jgi:Nuclease-related domain
VNVAGSYAEQRYRAGLRRWRRDPARPILAFLLPLSGATLGAAVWLGAQEWWFAAGLITGGTLALFIVLRDLPPDHVVRWRKGADGERRTARVLEELAGQGWQSVHDLERTRGGNTDHLLVGPPGVFLLETKNLSGRIGVEGGMLVRSWPDEPRRVWPEYRLARSVRRAAARVADEVARTTGEREWVQPVVVVWGDFDAGLVDSDGVVYVHGDRLVDWLRSIPARRVELELLTS